MTKSSPTLLAALPVKDLANAKQRLMSALTPDQRHDLAAAMLEDVLDALAAVEDVTVLLVTKDPEVLTLASRRGTPCLTESANRGHTEAVALGQRAAVEDGFARFARSSPRSATAPAWPSCRRSPASGPTPPCWRRPAPCR